MILITRQRNFAPQTASAIEKLGYKTLILPMLHMRHIYKNLVDQDFNAVIVTSQNAAYAISHIAWIRKKKIYAVGAKTAKILSDIKCLNVVCCESDNQNSERLVELVMQHEKPGSNILYLTGVDIAGNIEDVLHHNQYNITREIVYQAIVIDQISEQAIEAINTLVTTVLFYSPRTAEAFSHLALKYHIDLTSKDAICISKNTASALNCQWKSIVISKYSSEESIIQAVQDIANQ